MPTYDYYCESNDRTVEVSHKMAERLTTWAELCERAGISAGRTDPRAPVRRLATGGNIIGSGSSAAYAPAPCEIGGSCCGGVCGGD
jgi:predicted nucleic acid-binding Zn ribbon protein